MKVDNVHSFDTAIVRRRIHPHENDSQPILAARTTTALNLLVSVCVIVISEFFTRLHSLAGNDPDPAVYDIAVTIRLTGMVNKPSNVSANIRIDHPASIQSKAPDFSTAKVTVLAIFTFLCGDLLSVVGNDAFVLIDMLKSEHTPAV